MKCPKCGNEMRKEGLAGLQGETVSFTFECPVCHYRIEERAKKPLL